MSASETVRPLPLLTRLSSISGEFWRYLAASVLALGVDFGLLSALTEVGHLHYLTSSAISYCSGSVVHYLVCILLVFRQRRLESQPIEFFMFFGIGLFGLAATQIVLKTAVDGLGLSYVIGKVAATGASFVLNFIARRAVLFTAKRVGG